MFVSTDFRLTGFLTLYSGSFLCSEEHFSFLYFSTMGAVSCKHVIPVDDLDMHVRVVS